MEKHYRLPDSECEAQFANCTFPAEYFSHEAHLRLAWIHISKYGQKKAVKNLTEQIQAYASSLGAIEKFHATVTVAAVKAVHHFMKKTGSTSFLELMASYPELKTRFKELLSTHYSFNVFESDDAKQVFVEPDLFPF